LFKNNALYYPDNFDHLMLLDNTVSVDVIKTKRQLQFLFRCPRLCDADCLKFIK